MTIFHSDLDDTFEQASWDLAQAIELDHEVTNKAVFVKALCWVLADCIIGASKAGATSLDDGVRLCQNTIIFCVSTLAALTSERLH